MSVAAWCLRPAAGRRPDEIDRMRVTQNGNETSLWVPRRRTDGLKSVIFFSKWAATANLGSATGYAAAHPTYLLLAFFLFLYYLKLFFTKIYFRFYNLQFCTPTARLRGCRPPGALLPGGRDLNVNIIYI